MTELDTRDPPVAHWSGTTQIGVVVMSDWCTRSEFVVHRPAKQSKIMTQADYSEDQSEREMLNNIAEQRTETDALPDWISCSDIIELAEVLYEEVTELMGMYAGTHLTRREVEVLVLSKTCGANHTILTDDAIALVLATPGSPFGEETESTIAEGIAASPTVSDVERRYEQAEKKYEQAMEFVGVETFRDREEHLESPEIAWLDRSTRGRLEVRRHPADKTIDDTLNRLLGNTMTCQSLEELTKRYLDDRGRDNVAQVVIAFPGPNESTLYLTAHTGVIGDLPDVIHETDAVTIDGEQYSFYFDEDPSGPWTLESEVSLYASDYFDEKGPIEVGEGIKTLKDRMQARKKSVEKTSF